MGNKVPFEPLALITQVKDGGFDLEYADGQSDATAFYTKQQIADIVAAFIDRHLDSEIDAKIEVDDIHDAVKIVMLVLYNTYDEDDDLWDLREQMLEGKVDPLILQALLVRLGGLSGEYAEDKQRLIRLHAAAEAAEELANNPRYAVLRERLLEYRRQLAEELGEYPIQRAHML